MSNDLACLLGVSRDEGLDEQGNVVDALAQRGESDREDVEAVEQVPTERAFRHGRGQVPVGSRDDSHVHRHGLVPAHSLELSLLKNPQQRDLGCGRKLADLIQENRAAVGRFKAPHTPLERAREGALFVPEQLGRNQRGRNRGAVHANEGAG